MRTKPTNCPDCQGSGQITLLNTIETCQRCGGVGHEQYVKLIFTKTAPENIPKRSARDIINFLTAEPLPKQITEFINNAFKQHEQLSERTGLVNLINESASPGKPDQQARKAGSCGESKGL